MHDLKRVKQKERLPVVLSPPEVKAVLTHLQGVHALQAGLIYGGGLRINECMTLRVKDIDFHYKHLNIRHAKGGKDRTTVLPSHIIPMLKAHLRQRKQLHDQDILNGAGYVALPNALRRKYPAAQRELKWQYVFASSAIRIDPITELATRCAGIRRHRPSKGNSKLLYGQRV